MTGRDYPTITEIDHYIRLGRQLRARAMQDGLRRIGGWLRGRGRGPAAPTLTEDPVTELRSPLTAIRSFAEILIDNPDMAPAERSRFLEIVLTEARRLERGLDGLRGSAQASRG